MNLMKKDIELLNSLLNLQPPQSILSSKFYIPRAKGTYPINPELDINGYLSDNFIEEIAMIGYADSYQWLLNEFPKIAKILPYATINIEIIHTLDGLQKEKEIHFSTGGWSGNEDFINAIINHVFLRQYLKLQQAGGHYVFKIPLHLIKEVFNNETKRYSDTI